MGPLPNRHPPEPGMQALSGRRILITRARHQADALAQALESHGAAVLAVPAIRIEPPTSWNALDAALQTLEQYDWLVLTSVNGVESFAARLRMLAETKLSGSQLLLPPARGLRVAAMGPATARALEAQGIAVDVIPEQYVAESLAASLRNRVFGQRILLVRAKVARDVLPAELEKVGARVDIVEAYQTVVPQESSVALRRIFSVPGQAPDAVTFTSSSTVTNFWRLLEESGLVWPPPLAAASIGPVTSRTLLAHGIEPVIEARVYTIPGLVDALCEWYERH
jgi:uroporphyrinogen-III synthase